VSEVVTGRHFHVLNDKPRADEAARVSCPFLPWDAPRVDFAETTLQYRNSWSEAVSWRRLTVDGTRFCFVPLAILSVISRTGLLGH